MLKEFQTFIKRGNVLDLAIGVILGAAFGAITKSLVDDILMPILGIFTGGLDFTNWFIALDGQTYATLAAAKEAGAATLNYGVFINTIFNFLIVSFAIFMLIRQVNKIMKPEPAPPPAPPEPSAEEKLLTEIRDLLAKK